MGRCIGTGDLGLMMEWRYRFTGFGERASTTPGVVYIDVGGALCPGVLDHHGAEGSSCAAEAVFQNRELVYNHLLAPWLDARFRGVEVRGIPWQPTIVTHANPDWDGVVAAYLVRRLVEDGDFPEGTVALVAYTRLVDQGRYPVELGSGRGVLAPHMAYLAAQNSRDSSGRLPSSESQLRRGFELLDRCLTGADTQGRRWALRGPEDLMGDAPAAMAWARDPEFGDLRAMLEADRAAFERDRSRSRILEKVMLPATDGGEPVPVSGWVALCPTESVLNKYWVRAAGFPLFVCPYDEESQPPHVVRDHYERVIVSVDPTIRVQGRQPNLRGLGFALEQAESAAREARGGIDDRGGPPRFEEAYGDNSDPWYDGRAHDWTIVDSPRSGTVLDYTAIVDIATGGTFGETPVSSATVTMVWSDTQLDKLVTAKGSLPPFERMASTLEPLYQDCAETPLGIGRNESDQLGITTASWHRIPPPGTSAPFRVIQITVAPGTTLESLARECGRVGGACRPDYQLVRVRLGPHFTAPARVGDVLRALGGEALQSLGGSGEDQDALLFNGRSVLVQETGATSPRAEPDPEREILLYVAFLWETLLAFSRRISALVPGGKARLDGLQAQELRSDFLRFQARYYHLEVSRSARGRALFSSLCDTLGLQALYAEVQSELDRLAELEGSFVAARRARGEAVIQGTLYFLSVAGLFSTVLAFLSWPDRSASMWWWVGPILGVGAGVYGWVRWTMNR